MNTLLDSSSLINLSNGRVLEIVLRLPDCTFAVGPQVVSECGHQSNDVASALAHGLTRLDDDAVPATLFLELLEQFKLGLGETECLAFAMSGAYAVCTDDRRAREACIQMIGGDRVVGTMRLLRMCVEQSMMLPAEANAVYELMKSRGGFLPFVPAGYFEK